MSESPQQEMAGAPESAIRRATRLLELAMHEATPPEEAATARKQADEIMRKYRIERAMLNFSTNAAERERATHEEWEVPKGTLDFLGLMADVAQTAGLRFKTGSKRDGKYGIKYVMTVVGFRDDITYGTLLWGAIMTEYATRINPSWAATRTFDANVKVLKEAGFSWPEIAKEAFRNNEVPLDQATGKESRWKASYQRQCKLEGVEPTPHTANARKFRRSYAEAFESTLNRRLATMRWEAKQDRETAEKADSSSHTALALTSEKESIDDVYFELFPDDRPEEVAKRRAELSRRMEADAEVERRRRAGLTDAQRRKEDEAARKQEARDRRAWAAYDRRHTNTHDSAGWSAGTAAARAVDLSAGKSSNTVQDTGRKELG